MSEQLDQIRYSIENQTGQAIESNRLQSIIAEQLTRIADRLDINSTTDELEEENRRLSETVRSLQGRLNKIGG